LRQILAGFRLQPFVFWRGAGDELDRLPAEFSWVAADGSAVLAHHLSEGYFSAAGLPRHPQAAAARLEAVGQRLRARTQNEWVLLLAGIEHALPDPHTGAVVEELARRTGWHVERALLKHCARELVAPAPEFRGELLGARATNLLPGVWSARLPRKLRNRRAEMPFEAWGRFRLQLSEAREDVEDTGTEIGCGALRASAAADGTLVVCFGDRSYAGLCGVEDVADRGDAYDADPIPDRELALEQV